MLMTCQPIYDCFKAVTADLKEGERVRTLYVSPKGRRLSHEIAEELAGYDRLVILCGHYEGVDSACSTLSLMRIFPSVTMS